MQNAKFNPEQVSYISFFPTGKEWQTETRLKEKILIENPEQYAEKYPQRPGLLVIEQKGKKRSFSQNFWLEPGEEIPEPEQITVEEPTEEILERMAENNHAVILIQPKNRSRKKS